MRETIIQFGEGNFLRGFADCFIQRLNEYGLYDGKVVVIQPRSGGKVHALCEQDCKYNLYMRGIENGEVVNEHLKIESISRGIDPYTDFEDYIQLAKNPDFRFVISNTTEAGIEYVADNMLSDRPALSFPGKLTQLLYARFNEGLTGFVFLPCELIDNNADELKKCILCYAKQWNLGDAFVEWLEKENEFCNTLVDRIVTGYPEDEADALCQEIGYADKFLDTAEIYHFWAIEGDYEKELPLCKAGLNVVWTDSVVPYKKRKVRVLNGAHTSMVFPALLCGIETVGECLENERMNNYLKTCLFKYILPVLGETQENISFANAVLERFANPYIKHKLKAISLNSVSKFSVRVLPTMIDWYRVNGHYPKPLVFSLASLIYYYKNNEPSDSDSVVGYIKENDVESILKNIDLWGCDLSAMASLVTESMERIEDDVVEALEWALL